MSETSLSLDAVLERFNRIAVRLQALQGDDSTAVRDALALVAASIVELLPGASAVILRYDRATAAFDLDGRISAGEAASLSPRQVASAADAVASLRPTQTRRHPGISDPLHDPAVTSYSFPLIALDEAAGALIVSFTRAHDLSVTERGMLEHMAALSARAFTLVRQHGQAQQEQVRRERALRRLRRAGILISSRSDLKDTLDAILKMALEITDASYGIFRLVDASGNNLVMRSFVGTLQAEPATEALPITSHSVMGSVALKREPVVISDLREEPWRSIYYPFDYAIEMRSELAVPLIGASGRLEGVLNLESPEVDAFDKEDRYILQILATQAVVAIEGIRLVDALQQVSAMLGTSSLGEVHQALVERACDLLNLPMGLVWLREKDHAVVQAASDPSLCGARIPLGLDPVSQCLQSGEPVILLETAIPFPAERPAPGSALRPGSTFVTPLFGGEAGDELHAVGALAVYTAPGETREFAGADWDRKVLSILAHYASLAIRNSAHLEALKFDEDQRATTDTFAAIGEISANLLHRLNNKVGTIPVRVEGIQDKSAALLESDSYLAENLEAIQRSASEAMQIVRESVDYLRPIQLAPVSVSAAVREALGAVRMPETVRVDCQGLESLPPVQAGANRLNLVFANLLENAAQAMGGRGEVRISGAQRGRWVEVRVSDSGPGIPPEEQERIFEFSVSSRASANPANLGFGLWWVKTFMTRFGGKVAVDSTSSSTGRGPRGATFVLSLPVAGSLP